MATRQIAGRRAIVTGASSGIGREIALQIARKGGNLVLTARREERLLEIAHEIKSLGQKAFCLAGDITSAEVRSDVLRLAADKLGGLDILVNNAGIGALGSFADADEARLRKVMEVNFFAPLELTRAALPILVQSDKPIIVNIGSVLGHVAMPEKSEYCASKFALHGFTDALRAELVNKGIDVLLVSPSTTDSEFFDQVISDPTNSKRQWSPFKMSPEKVARRTVRAIQLGRREIILSVSGKLAVWADRLVPWLISRVVSRR